MANVGPAGGNPPNNENLNDDSKGMSWQGILRGCDEGLVSIPLKHDRVSKINTIINTGNAKRLTKTA